MQLKAYAKINLILRILGKRPDGYHELQSIMQSVDLYDTLTLSESPSEISILCSDPALSIGQDNTVHKAAHLLKERYQIKKGVNIFLKKNIPMGAGLAGGSTDAAATLFGLNKLWGLNIPEQELSSLGANIGSDIPFCLKGGTALVEGRGEKITLLQDFPEIDILLVTPPVHVSTAWAYKQIPVGHKKDKLELKNLYQQGGLKYILDNLENDLEAFTFHQHPEIAQLKHDLLANGAEKALMSGSGSSVFGIFRDKELLAKATAYFKQKYHHTFQLKTIKTGLSTN